jgi:molybdopterin molybdotransferase
MSDLMSVDDALNFILSHSLSKTTELVSLDQALNRVIACDQISTENVPPFINSAMDGYAVAFDDLNQDAENRLDVSQYIPAGHAPTPLKPVTAARIFTGAVMPDASDTVIMQENCEAQDECVLVKEIPAKGRNVRAAGEDIQKGQVVVEKGARLTPMHLGLLASVGVAEVEVYKTLKVGLLNTGDELLEPGEALQPGKIYNSNRYLFSGLLKTLHCEVIDLGVVSDDPESISKAILSLAEQSDLIVTTGGVSVGEEDYVKAVIKAHGKLDCWRMNIKPGKPLAFGHVHQTPVFGLPGNPVSGFVTFALFARPYILKSQGQQDYQTPSFEVIADFEWLKPCAREEYLRVRFEKGKVTRYPKQGSGVLSSAAWANGLVKVPPKQSIKPGDCVELILFSEIF